MKRDSFWDHPRSRNHDPKRGSVYKCLLEDSNFLSESRRRELNPRPADYESAAMPLSHGGAIPHNIDACFNKICVSGIPAQRSNLLGTLRLFWGGYGAEL
jgi:hypothetical protein